MLEFGARIGVALAFAASGFWWGSPHLSTKVGAAAIAFATIVLALDRKGLRNPGSAGLIASADSAIVAAALASAGALDQLGFFALAPCVYAFSAYGANSIAMAPIAASSLLSSNYLFNGTLPSIALYCQTLGVLGLGLLLQRRSMESPLTEEAPAIEESTVVDDDIELRESYRELRDRYRALESKFLANRHLSGLFALRDTTSGRMGSAISQHLQKITDVESLTLYGVAQFGPRMVVKAACGIAENADSAIEVDLRASIASIKHQAEKAVMGQESKPSATTILTNRGRVIGMIAISDSDPEKLEASRRTCDAVSSIVANLLDEQDRQSTVSRRLRETELLYEIATTTNGAATSNSLAVRSSQALIELLDVDHVGVSWIDGVDALHASVQGESLRLLDAMSFSSGSGVIGWLKTGAPELLLFQTSDDARCPAEEAIRRRIGSFFAIPLRVGDDLYGVLTVATHRSGGLDKRDVETCRIVADELALGVARLRGEAHLGLVSPSEFARQILSAEGSVVFVEPLHAAELREQFGPIAFTRAEREYARRLRSLVPIGAMLCRRRTGALVAFLPGTDTERAGKWAAEASSLASLLSLTTPDGAHQIPFAVRTRVALLSKQSNRISEEIAA